MKKVLSLLIIGQISCIFPFMLQSQTNTAQVKPATDACPSWNKKQVTSKVDYFAFLSKRTVPQNPNNFNVPKYQNFNATTSEKKARQTDVETNLVSIKKYDETVLVANNEISTIQSVAKPTTKILEETQPAVIEKDLKETAQDDKGVDVTGAKKEDKKTGLNKTTTHVKREKKHLMKKIRFKRKNATTCPNF